MCTLGMQGCESAWETLPSQSWAAKGLEELRGLYAVEIPDGSGISGASPHAATQQRLFGKSIATWCLPWDTGTQQRAMQGKPVHTPTIHGATRSLCHL